MHLFRVSAGLDSLCPARARSSARSRRPTRPPRPGRCSTGSSARRSSSASASARRPRSARARRRCRPRPPRSRSRSSATSPAARVLLIGAGRIGELAAGSLSARGASIAYVANRSAEAAADARGALRRASRSRSTSSPRSSARSTSCSPRRARRSSCRAAATCRRAAASRCSSSTSPSRATSTRRCTSSTAATSTTSTTSRPSWPRRIAGRRVEAESAEQLVVEEATRFREWQASLDVVPAITSLRAHAEEIRAAELAKLGDLPEHERRTIESVTAQIVEQAAPPADRAHEGGRRGRRRRGVRRRRAAPVRARGDGR